jgi:ribosomal protein S17E
MGKIKTRLIKRTTKELMKSDIPFGEEFKENKKILQKEMPSKRVRNQISGFIARRKKYERKAQEKLEKGIKK